MNTPKALAPESLYTHCDPAQFGFETTAELGGGGIIGQERAMEALQFGVGIRREGYNLFVLGPPGIGKYSVVRQYLEHAAGTAPAPPDWCYLHNFEQPDRPCAVRLPTGRGQALRRDMERLVDDLRNAIPVSFETEEYHTHVQEIEEALKDQREHALAELTAETESRGIALIRTPGGYAFAPVRGGEVIKPDDYEQLPDEEKQRIEASVEELQGKLANILRQTPKWQRESRDRIKALDREVALFAVGHLIEEVKKKYQDIAAITAYLDAVQNDVVEHLPEFRGQDETPNILGIALTEKPSFRRYQVNLLIDHGRSQGVPVVYEDTPLYQNLVGRVEHLTHMGALVTDFMLIKPGALHRANGGYLILDAKKLLTEPFAWEGLKRALYAREVRIQSLGQIYSYVSTVYLEPEAIPIDLKVVLLGDRFLYYLLQAYDPDFIELFKVTAEFEDRVERTPDNDRLYAGLLAVLTQREDLYPLDSAAVARVIEHGSRQAEDAERLAVHLSSTMDLLRESDYWARQAGRVVITRTDVQHAIDMQVRRVDRIRGQVQEGILRNLVLIDTAGARIGQVNALSVIDLGNFSFAQPTRITANARMGEGEIIDIEREVELGGSIHSKGVMILTSMLAARYAQDRPLSLTASLAFEQSYGLIEGDSASVAEFCALISALAAVPIDQRLAVTGSVNQHGQVQAIGGVNHKIEGFFDICRARGLDGGHGVIIPAANVVHLMLREDVIEAVRAGRFKIYPVESVDEAITLLTGVPAGIRDAQGEYPNGSVNQRVEDRLRDFAELRHEFAKPVPDGHENDDTPA
ncbi:MAG: AAA family ATPase [Gammaproteobacteria bacterium]|nr:AAA family ATPase [Gammaproteobacteria bacterium]